MSGYNGGSLADYLNLKHFVTHEWGVFVTGCQLYSIQSHNFNRQSENCWTLFLFVWL